MANTTYNLGRVGLKLRGEYDPNAAYKPLDVVSWHGGSGLAAARGADQDDKLLILDVQVEISDRSNAAGIDLVNIFQS